MLSVLATGLLTLLQTDWPSDLKINSTNIRNRYPDIGGRDKTQKVIRELVTNGYLSEDKFKLKNQFTTNYAHQNQALGPDNQAATSNTLVTDSQQVDNTGSQVDHKPWSYRELNIRASDQCVAIIAKANSNEDMDTPYPPNGSEMNNWREDNSGFVFGSIPDDKPLVKKRPVRKQEQKTKLNRASKPKEQWSTVDTISEFIDTLRFKRPMDSFLSLSNPKVRGSMTVFRENHETNGAEEYQLIKDFFTFPQHYAANMNPQHVWFRFMTYAAANIGRVRMMNTCEVVEVPEDVMADTLMRLRAMEAVDAPHR